MEKLIRNREERERIPRENNKEGKEECNGQRETLEATDKEVQRTESIALTQGKRDQRTGGQAHESERLLERTQITTD